jgi:hypothetical protein
MGFRTYIGRMSKVSQAEIKIMSINEISDQFGDGHDEEEPYPPGPYELAEEIYELGKYVTVNADSFSLFDDKEVEEYYNGDYLFHGLTKKGFEEIIDNQRKDISNYYTQLNDSYGIIGVDQTQIKTHLNSMANEWCNNFTNPVDLSDSPRITNSWKYEYTIFELIRLYKVFDWENDIAVIYGY